MSEVALKQHKLYVKLEPRRGTIYDRLNRVFALYLDTPSIFAVPNEIGDKESTAAILSGNLNEKESVILKKLKKDNYFAWIQRKVTPSLAEKINGLGLTGVYVMNEPKRFYPGKKMACHVLGFTGIDNSGLEGVELYYDTELAGESGWRRSLRDAKRREVASYDDSAMPARDGNGLTLTIDEVIQHIIEREIEKIVKAYNPSAVSIVLIVPGTGEILGLANYPGFDPNDLQNIKKAFVRNRTITDSFEPGSVFKIITAGAALEENVVDFDTEIFCENGAYKVGKRTLHDYRPYGIVTFRKIIEKSSNIGTVKVAEKLGKEKLALYIKKFGFDNLTGIDLPGEVPGIMRNPSGWSYVDMTTIPMGQGIAVTNLQLATAVSAVANGGLLMKPYVVKEFVNEKGDLIRITKPKVVRRVLSGKSADKVKELMEGVILRGTGKRAKLSNFRAGGKTGTAQKVRPRGGYYKDKYVASFIGFAPYDKPEIALVITVDDPKKKYFGGQVAAPAFKNIAEKVLSYMEVPNDKNKKSS